MAPDLRLGGPPLQEPYASYHGCSSGGPHGKRLDSADSDGPMFIDTGAARKEVHVEPKPIRSNPQYVSILEGRQSGKFGSVDIDFEDKATSEVSLVGQANEGQTPIITTATSDSDDGKILWLSRQAPESPPLPSFGVKGGNPAFGQSWKKGQYSSAYHAVGTCKPCAHFWRTAGCSKGDDCERCHICDEAAFRKYRRNYRQSVREKRRAARNKGGEEEEEEAQEEEEEGEESSQ